MPISQVVRPDLDSGEIFVANADGKSHEFWPQWQDEGGGGRVLIEDVGLLARVPNPLNASRTLTICNGIHSRGVYGAARTLTDAEFRDGNEGYISSNFGDSNSFGILMSVKVFKNETITPDFNTPGVVLYQWGQAAA
jgi:hypothetical protein